MLPKMDLNRYKGKECIRGSKGLDEKVLNQIIYSNIKEIIKALNKETIQNLIKKQQNELKDDCYNENLLNKESEKIESEIKTLYLDYKENLLDEEDYKKYYKEKNVMQEIE